MTQHVLTVGGFRPVHEKLKSHGARLTLMIQSNRIKDQDAKVYDRVVGFPAAAPVAEWVHMAMAIHEVDPFFTVGAYHEMDQEKAASIAQALGLSFHPPEVITNVREKDQMRHLLRATGVDLTQSRRVETVEDIAAFAGDHGYPVMLKPVDGWASIGVSRINAVEEIPSAISWFRQWAPTAPMLIEQFLAGDEFSVEAMSEHGEHRILCITRKFKETEHFVELGHVLPTILPAETDAAVHALVGNALTALGIRNGGSHTEVIITEQGPRVVETHTRLGGDFIPTLIELVSGIDLVDLCVRQTLGHPVLAELPERLRGDKFSAVSYLLLHATGTVQGIEGEQSATQTPGVSEVKVLLGPGTKLVGAHDSFSRPAYAIATGDTPEQAIARARDAVKQLKFLVLCQGANQ